MSTPSQNAEPLQQQPPPAQIFPSLVRTIVPMIVGWILAQALARGFSLDEGAVTQWVTVAVTAVYYAAVRLLETRFKPVWGWLLGLPKAPTYEAQAAPSDTSASGAQATIDTPGIPAGAPVDVVPDTSGTDEDRPEPEQPNPLTVTGEESDVVVYPDQTPAPLDDDEDLPAPGSVTESHVSESEAGEPV